MSISESYCSMTRISSDIQPSAIMLTSQKRVCLAPSPVYLQQCPFTTTSCIEIGLDNAQVGNWADTNILTTKLLKCSDIVAIGQNNSGSWRPRPQAHEFQCQSKEMTASRGSPSTSKASSVVVESLPVEILEMIFQILFRSTYNMAERDKIIAGIMQVDPAWKAIVSSMTFRGQHVNWYWNLKTKRLHVK